MQWNKIIKAFVLVWQGVKKVRAWRAKRRLEKFEAKNKELSDATKLALEKLDASFDKNEKTLRDFKLPTEMDKVAELAEQAKRARARGKSKP